MRQVFQQELAEVSSSLVSTARLVEQAITYATTALETSDLELAERVISADQDIDESSIAVDELTIEIIARQGPVARDLRQLVAALRISASLERMGDLAAHVASLTRYRFPEPVGPAPLRDIFAEMGRLDVQVATKTVELLDTLDDSIGTEISALDDRIDALHKQALDLLGTLSDADQVAVVDATLANRYLERFADHSVSIAKKIAYLNSGAYSPVSE